MAIKTGTIGTGGPTWSLDDETGIMFINPGINNLNYTTTTQSPFNADYDIVKHITITNTINVTAVGGLFARLPNLERIVGLNLLNGLTITNITNMFGTGANITPLVGTRFGFYNGSFWNAQIDAENNLGFLEITSTTITSGLFPWYLDRDGFVEIKNYYTSVELFGPIFGDNFDYLFSDLINVKSFKGLYFLEAYGASINNIFQNTPAILSIDNELSNETVNGYGFLGSCFWTIQMRQEIGHLEISGGSFGWFGLKEVFKGVLGETEWIPTSPWDDFRIFIKTISIKGNITIDDIVDLQNPPSQVRLARNIFYFLNRVVWIQGLDLINTLGVTSMSGMFRNMWALEGSNVNTEEEPDIQSLNLINFNTDNVSDFSWMFANMWHLKSINLPQNFIQSTANDLNHIFYNAKSLTDLDVSNWQTLNVTNMESMFYRTINLYADSSSSDTLILNGTNWNTSNVRDFSFMFYQSGVRRPLNDGSETDIDVDDWIIGSINNPPYVALMPWMFYRDKENFSPVLPYDREDVNTFQRISDPIRVNISNWESQWEQLESLNPPIFACIGNMFELDKEPIEGIIPTDSYWLRDPGLTYIECTSFTCLEFEQEMRI